MLYQEETNQLVSQQRAHPEQDEIKLLKITVPDSSILKTEHMSNLAMSDLLSPLKVEKVGERE